MQRRDLTPSLREDGHRGRGRSRLSPPHPAFSGGPVTGTQLWGRGEEGQGRENVRRRLGEEGSWEGEREEGEGGTKETRLKGKTSFCCPLFRIPPAIKLSLAK